MGGTVRPTVIGASVTTSAAVIAAGDVAHDRSSSSSRSVAVTIPTRKPFSITGTSASGGRSDALRRDHGRIVGARGALDPAHDTSHQCEPPLDAFRAPAAPREHVELRGEAGDWPSPESSVLSWTGEADQVALWIGEVSDDESLAGILLWAHPTLSAEALGVAERRLDIGHADVKQCVTVIACAAAHAPRDAGPVACRVAIDEAVAPRLRHCLCHGGVRVKLPAEQLAVVGPEVLRILPDDLEVYDWMTHRFVLSRLYLGVQCMVRHGTARSYRVARRATPPDATRFTSPVLISAGSGGHDETTHR